MPNFLVLWENPLLSPSIVKASRENKSEFSLKSQGKLEANPPVGPQFAPLITASRAALDLLTTAKDGTTLGLQKAATLRLELLLPVIRSTGEILEGALKSNFEADRAVLLEFFPQGRTAISNAKRGDVITILNNWVTQATARQGMLGAAWPTRLTALRTQWTNNLDAQSGNISRVAGARNDFDSAWETVSWAFYDIALQLALDNPRNPAVSNLYFDFSVFGGSSSSETDGKAFLKARVVNQVTKEPVSNCGLVLTTMEDQILQTTETDLEGNYKSGAQAPGFYKLTANQQGYVQQTNIFQIFDAQTPEYIIELVPQ